MSPVVYPILTVAAVTLISVGKRYRQDPLQRQQAGRFLHNRLALALGGLVLVVSAATAIVDGHPGGVVSSVILGVLVAAVVDWLRPAAPRSA